jgi:hypothetical protein
VLIEVVCIQCVHKCRSGVAPVAIVFLNKFLKKWTQEKKNGREVIFWGLFLIFEKSNKNKNGDIGDFGVFGLFWG